MRTVWGHDRRFNAGNPSKSLVVQGRQGLTGRDVTVKATELYVEYGSL